MTKPQFWYSPTYRIIKAMQATGNQPGMIVQWLRQVAIYAEKYPGPDAEAVKAWLPMWHFRPFYTAAELAPLFPALALAAGYSDKLYAPKHPARLKHELEYGKLPKLRDYEGCTAFLRDGKQDEYFIVERLHYWTKRPVSQEEFERLV